MHALTHIDDQTLLSHLKAALGGERQALARFLRYLGEVDRRRLYSEAGFPSLFEFCVRGLGLREGEAFNRIRACRTAARYPEVYEWIGDGRLCLTAVRLLAPHSEAPNFLQVLGEAVGKSTRAVEKLAAGLEAERSRAKLAARPEPKPQAVAVPLAFALAEDQTAQAAEAQPERREAPGPERVRYVTPETVRISFTASEPLALKIKDVRAHCRAKGVGDDFAALLDHVFEAYLEAHSPARLMRRRAERAAKRQAARAKAGVATQAKDAGTPASTAAATTAPTVSTREPTDAAALATPRTCERPGIDTVATLAFDQTDAAATVMSFIREQPSASMVAALAFDQTDAAATVMSFIRGQPRASMVAALAFEQSDVATTATSSASERTDTSTSTTSFICEQPRASTVAPPSGERPGAATAAHTPKQTPAKRPRTFPRAAAATIWQRDDGQCSFTGPAGQRCPARHGLEIDHILPYAMGGASTVANGRLRCRAHNRLAAERTFGKAYVSARIAAAQERRTAQTT